MMWVLRETTAISSWCLEGGGLLFIIFFNASIKGCPGLICLEQCPSTFYKSPFFNIICPKCQMNFLRRDVINDTSPLCSWHKVDAGQTLPAETACSGTCAEVPPG